MKKIINLPIRGLIICCLLTSGLVYAQTPPGEMSFFLTSAGSGKGGDLGGLKGADAICQTLGAVGGQGSKTWRAYLSTQGSNAVNARDRIGSGPWFNAAGARVAANVDDLHGITHRLSAASVLDERGRRIPGGGYVPNRHDILTGSQADGTAYPADSDMTCGNWSSSSDGTARVGHHDLAAWNSSHNSRGCSPEGLVSSGGDGLFYCFAE